MAFTQSNLALTSWKEKVALLPLSFFGIPVCSLKNGPFCLESLLGQSAPLQREGGGSAPPLIHFSKV